MVKLFFDTPCGLVSKPVDFDHPAAQARILKVQIAKVEVGATPPPL
jgi:hypothetical protein